MLKAALLPRASTFRSSLRPAIFVPLSMLVLIVTVCFLGPLLLALPPPTGGSIMDSDLPPFSPGHLLGTDQNGNDVLSRLLQGGQNSLFMAFVVSVVGLAAGGTLGAVSAFLGGVWDTILMRALDVVLAFPALVFAIAVAEALDRGTTGTVLALTFVSVPVFARVARAATLPLRDRPFLLAAALTGTPAARMVLFHIGPNILPQLISFGLLGMGAIIVIEGGLSFVGLGIRPPNPSWGNMIAQGQQALSVQPIHLLLPSMALFATVLALNLLGERLRQRWSER